MTTRRGFLGQGLGLTVLRAQASRPRPNILWISSEDTSPYLGCFGDRLAHTPTLDKLASQGVRYTRAFTVAGVCAPSRSGIITGMHPTSLGSHHMRCRALLPAHVTCFPEYLRNAGYYCTNNQKTDYNFDVPKNAWDESSRGAHWRKRAKGQPFFSVFNIETTHESRIRYEGAEWAKVTDSLTEAERQNPARMNLPPFYPDTPTVRRQWANFYELVTAMDRQVAARLKELDDDGLLENTVVFYWGDHGIGLPRAKRWLYDSGTLAPIIVRIPKALREAGQGTPGSADSQLVSFLDLAPTVLNLAGVERPAHFQGRAFLGPNLSEPRRYVYGHRDRMDERYDIIRTVRDERYRYVRNYESYKPYYQHMNTAEGSPVMHELRRVHAEGKLAPAAAQFMADRKPVEELYDLRSDPWEVRNLAGDTSHRETLDRLRGAHRDWVRETGDLGLIPEPELAAREAKLGSRWAILRQPETKDLVPRLRGIIESGEQGDLAALVKAMEDPDAAARYWAATWLGNRGAEPDALRKASGDAAPVVRIAGARGLAKQGVDVGASMRLLMKELDGGGDWDRMHAVLALDEVGPKAAPAKGALQGALEDKNQYVGRVARHALAGL